ncbi:MAG: RidA family protein [Microbacteriaceae bacterium]|nr:MAG: RidA family protein [Microbacteriaceae bacterium]
MAGIRHVNPPEMGPPLGLYSQIVIHEASCQAFVAGQVAIDSSGEFIGQGDVGLQTEQILKNIGAALASLGEDWSSVISLTTYLTSAEDFPEFARTRKRLFASYFPDAAFPAHTLLVVSALSAPHHLVELDAVVSYSGRDQ